MIAMEVSMVQFSGKVALITGGSSGIGKATAIAFAREGARVVIAARGEKRGIETAEAITAQGGHALFIRTDVANATEIERLVSQTVETFGRLDYAVNNAATSDGAVGALADMTEEDFDRSMAVNLKSVWLGMMFQIRQMLSQTPAGGAIVNVSSANGLGGCANASVYAAAKAGVIALSKSAALEYAKQGIRVNALVPGAFRTPMLEEAMERAAGGNPEGSQAIEARWNSAIAAGRIGDPAEAAAAILWLCSDASSYVVGHSMIVDGGITSLWR
jgi:NAD(P)-dependent dehydrogenase (short-subunit alcohol dehydrogenase family)